ncbi:4-oxalocrotonate tautomerase [Thermoactinomyces mirandus]|uniref:Tautomerase n=1 Tax=Thermoactinomyces mirandus TaxID=2756294 RepID=A0A7W2AQD3_9BACL|nr:4-oxalocrotonate tautomerase [Thermoactinomyces mirandus]MBA4601403.1 4-oxalocrotonate tautomerase [Thermoactinomyces mirandus]
MPLIQVHILEGRTAEQKEELIEKMTNLAAEVLDSPIENVRVLIHEMPWEHWGIAGQSVKKRRGSR